MPRPSPYVARILALNDAGHHPDAIAEAVQVSLGYVYGVLRRARPERERKPRERTSCKPEQIRLMSAQGIKPARIAELLQVSRAYVYRELG